MESNDNEEPTKRIEQLNLQPVDTVVMECQQQDGVLENSKSQRDKSSAKENEHTGVQSPQQHVQRTNSPRKVQDIHLDGTVDDMQNVDPYLLDEKDLDIQSEVGGQTGTLSSNMSVCSWRSLNLTKSRDTKSVISSIERSDTSRARRLKQHERSPFLSIDVPSENNSARFIGNRAKSKSPMYGSQHSLLSVSTAGLASQQSTRSSITDRSMSARHHGRRLFSSPNFVPPGSVPGQANHSVKKPFKHDVRQAEINVTPVNPSKALQDRTAIATHAINKILRAQRPSKTQYIQGRLLKARLKPLEPVKATEPTIEQCRGIISETRKYTQCDSRTLQRWRAIMSGAQMQANEEAIREGASTSESIHRTSEASTPDLESMANADDLDATVFEDKTWMAELDSLINLNGRAFVGEEEKVLPFASLPNSRSGPTHCDEELTVIEGPDFNVMERENTNASMTADSMKDLTDLNVAQQQATTTEPSKEDPSSESAISATTEESRRKLSDDVATVSDKDSLPAQGGTSGKRPHSATYPQESTAPKTPGILRPKTAVDSSHKAVRFADEDASRGPLKSVFGKTGKEGRKESSKARGSGKGRSSCRPNSLDSGFGDRDDPGDGPTRGGGGGGRTFLTQDVAKSSISGESTTSKTTNASQHGGKKMNTKSSDPCNENSCKKRTIVNNGRSPDEQSVSGERLDDGYDSDELLFGHQSNSCNKDKTATASVLYKDGKNEPAMGSCVHSLKGKKIPAGKPVKKENKPKFAAEMRSIDTSQNLESPKPNTDKSLADKTLVTDDTGLRVSGEKFNSQTHHAVLKNEVYSYDKYSRVPQKNMTPSARRAKAYQNLVKRTRKNDFHSQSPYTGQTRVTSAQGQRDRRPCSTSSFSERSQIQSKHGIRHVKTRPSSTPIAGKEKTTPTKEKMSKANVHLKNTNLEGEMAASISEEDGKTDDKKLRPKSATKVTFADENIHKENVMRTNSANSSLKFNNKIQKSSHGSTDSLYTQLSATDDGILGADFNVMWEEIPSYDSDEDDVAETDNGDEADFGLISKFDDLEAQFEVLKSEMAHEKEKFKMTYTPEGETPAVAATREAEKQSVSPHPEVLALENEHDGPIMPNDSLHYHEADRENADSIFVTSSHHLEQANDQSDSFSKSNQTGEVTSPLSSKSNDEDEASHNASVVLSQNLYKKTHLYVKVSRPSSPPHPPRRSHKDRSHSQASSTKQSKAMKCVPVEDVTLSHADERAESNSRILNLDSSNPEQLSQSQKSATTTSVPSSDSPSNAQNDINGGIKEKHKPSHNTSTTQKIPNVITVLVTESSKKTSQGFHGRIRSSKKNLSSSTSSLSSSSLSSKKNKSKTKTPSRTKAKTSKKMTEYTNYSDILLAYREHCMQDSEGDDDEVDEKEEDFSLPQDIWHNQTCRCTSDPIQTCDMCQQKSMSASENNACHLPQKAQIADVVTEPEICDSKHKDEKIKPAVFVEETKIDLMNGHESSGNTHKAQDKDGYKARSSRSKPCSLEIVAESKKLSKSSKTPTSSDADMARLCNLPPMCFQLNARPPSGFFYYFAYDQNMNPDRLATYLNVDQTPHRFWALLFGFQLAFNMKVPGFDDSEDIGGQPNLQYDPQASVEGCVYRLTAEQLASLDKFMGHPQHYEHVVLPVWMSNCLDAQELGLAQYCVPALTYIATDSCTYHGPSSPNSFAAEQCLKGADIVSPQYRKHLQTFLPPDLPIMKAIEAA